MKYAQSSASHFLDRRNDTHLSQDRNSKSINDRTEKTQEHVNYSRLGFCHIDNDPMMLSSVSVLLLSLTVAQGVLYSV